MKKIRLFLTGLLVMVASAAFAQDIEITGTVTDASTGEPVPFASIQIKGTMKGETTLDDGTYSITAPSNAVLIFSFIGYENLEVPVNGRKVLNVTMKPDAFTLEETVVVGYGSAKKVGTTVGSLTKVSSKSLEARPQANAFESLQGQVAGLQIYTSDGDPGTLQSIRLHGVGSLTASSSPLYVLDGVAVEPETIRAMNPNDIESMTVLKDASATSIYGSRAANGVIYVTSKKGRAGDAKIILRGQYGLSSLASYEFYDRMMSTQQLFDFWTVTGLKTREQMDRLKDNLKTTGQMNGDKYYDFDWTRYLQKPNRPIWQADLSISGGTEKTSYYISGSVYDETGSAPATLYKRYGFRSNIDSRVNDWFRIGTNVQLAYDEQTKNGFYDTNNPYGGLSYLLQPYYSPKVAKAEDDYMIPGLEMYDPYYLTEIQPQVTKGYNINLSGYIEIEPIRNLKIRTVPGFDERITNYQYQCYPVGPFKGSGTSSQQFTNSYAMSISNTIEYSFSVKDKHHASFLLGHEGIKNGYNAFQASAEGLTDQRMMHMQNGLQKTFDVASGDTYSNFLSFFGRGEYSYDNRYFFDLSVRNDASSRFSPKHKNATFWAVGGMWNMKNESFLRDANMVNSLNFKVSYGTQGNAGISDYEFQALVGNTGTYHDETGWGLASPGNNDLKWEVQSKLTVGISTRLWDRLNLEVEYYNRQTNDMLMSVPTPATSGFTSVLKNVGALENNGVDITLGVDILRGRDYYLSFSANFNYNKEVVTKLFNGLSRWEITGTSIAYVVGESVSFYAPIYAGVDPLDGRMMWYLPDDTKATVQGGKEGKDKTTMDPNRVTKKFDETALTQNTGYGRFAPIAGGFNIQGSWRGIALSADFSYVIGKYLLSNDRYFSENPFAFAGNNTSTNILDYWKEPGDVAEYPDWTKKPTMQFDSHLIENASFLRLKNLTLSYTLPSKYLNNSKSLKGFKVYFTGRNLFTVTSKDFKGMDPEVDSNLALGKVANTRQFQLGVEFTF